jgi:hypothetical protein
VSFKDIVAKIKAVFKSDKAILVDKLTAAKKALEEIALHVEDKEIKVGEDIGKDTEAAIADALALIQRDRDALAAKLGQSTDTQVSPDAVSIKPAVAADPIALPGALAGDKAAAAPASS